MPHLPSRRLLPLNALKAFEAAGRHLNFTAAAEELSVTLSAISHQIRQLEELLGVPLFHRTRKRSEEHTSELQSLMRISYAVFCLKKKNNQIYITSVDYI